MRSSLPSKLRQFSSQTDGSVALVFGLAIVPAFLMLGAAIDYARAGKTRAELAAIADSSALFATTPAMLAQDATAAQTAANTFFQAQAQKISGVTYDTTQTPVTVTDAANTNGGTTRTAQVTYKTKLATLFPALDFANYTNFTVTATASTAGASSTTHPNIDFYFLVDNSPSMELPATTAGITAMQNASGCAFACHENDLKDSQLSSSFAGWGKYDSYKYAQNNNIDLRIDSLRTAMSNLVTSVSTTAAANNTTYQMAVFAFNDHLSLIHALSPATSAYVQTIKNDIATLTPPLMQTDNALASGNSYTYPTSATAYRTVTLTSSLNNADAMTNYEYTLNAVNDTTNKTFFIPDPGNGTNQSGDTPQKVLVLVTDGVDDAQLYNSTGCLSPGTVPGSISNTYGTFTRCTQPINTALCTAIKNRGIRIAVLYITYYPENQWWYNQYVGPFLSQVPTSLQNCASGPNLFFTVNTDGNFTSSLLQTYTASITGLPRLTQ